MNLDKVVAKGLRKTFYARSVCHIGPDMDILTVVTNPDPRMAKEIIIRKGNTIKKASKNIPVYNTTIT